jgi:uncharacterized protein (TIGR02231 family)
MRIVLVTALAFALASVAFAEDPARAVSSTIARVTVYEDRALVTRSAKAALPQGVTRVAIEHLPPGLDPAGLRARSTARVLGVEVEQVHLVREGREELVRAKTAHDAAKKKLAGAEMELAEAKDRWELLRSIRAKGVEGAERALGGVGGADPATLRKLLELVGDESVTARRAVLAATDAVEAARAEEQAALAKLQSLQTGDDRTESRVLVTLESDTARESEVVLQYMVGGASWQPVYDLRVDEDFGGASLGLSAVVVQRTGEDWKDVPMELTTAQPAAGAAPPDPSPWRIWLPRPMGDGVVVHRTMPAAAPAPCAEMASDKALEEAKLTEKPFQPTIRRSGLVVAFQSQLPASIASDGQPSRVALARFDVKPDIRWTAFPRATDKVFVTAKMTNTTTAALPAGDCRVFVGSDFVGPLALADWGVGREIDVGLGVDREVEVEREQLRDERSTEGLFTKDTVHARGYRITVRNHRDRRIDVRLLDQVPVSNDEDLEVKITSTTLELAKLPPRDAETNKARGILEWRFPVAPKAAFDLRFAFEVRHPRAQDVSGL